MNDSIGWISEKLGVAPERRYTGGDRGWIGDSPFIFLDTKKIRALGWKPKLTIRQGSTDDRLACPTIAGFSTHASNGTGVLAHEARDFDTCGDRAVDAASPGGSFTPGGVDRRRLRR